MTTNEASRKEPTNEPAKPECPRCGSDDGLISIWNALTGRGCYPGFHDDWHNNKAYWHSTVPATPASALEPEWCQYGNHIHCDTEGHRPGCHHLCIASGAETSASTPEPATIGSPEEIAKDALGTMKAWKGVEPASAPEPVQPTYYINHPDNSFSIADPQPIAVATPQPGVPKPAHPMPCTAESPTRYVCTLPSGHVGEHRAYGPPESGHQLFEKWRDLPQSSAVLTAEPHEIWLNFVSSNDLARLGEMSFPVLRSVCEAYAADLRAQLVKRDERLKHLSFAVTGNDYVLFTCSPQEVDQKINAFAENAREAAEDQVRVLREALLKISKGLASL